MRPPVAKDHQNFETLISFSAKELKESPEKWSKLFNEYECKTLLDCDMSSEVKWLLESIPSFESPIVFSHNDFRFRNQLITDDNEVILSDFEFSSHYCRGFDFALIFEDMDPNEEVINDFIREYVRECKTIFGETYSDNAINCVDHILGEMRHFSLLVFLGLASVCLHNNIWRMPIDQKTCMVTFLNACFFLYFYTLILLSERRREFNEEIF